MSVDAIEELAALLDDRRENSERTLPSVTWLPAVIGNEARKFDREDECKLSSGECFANEGLDSSDEFRAISLPAPVIYPQTPYRNPGLVTRWFDSWIRTVLTGAVAGSVFGWLYLLAIDVKLASVESWLNISR